MTHDVKAVTHALAAPFPPGEVKFKPQAVKGNRAMALAYIDARTIEDRLDDVLGVECWQDEYEPLPDGSVVCKLRLFLGGTWITKMDVGSPSEQPDGGDRLKAAFSDALKRAAVKFGIGRYLYRLPTVWADYDPVRKQFTQPPQVAQPAKPARPAAVPPNGPEFVRRLRDYDSRLATQNLCPAGAAVAHVVNAGMKAGYPAELEKWHGPAIDFAVAAVKEFESRLRTTAAA